jgi:acetylglutamate kinase
MNIAVFMDEAQSGKRQQQALVERRWSDGEASGAVAAALKATRLLLLTDVAGVLDADKRLLSEITAAVARRMIADGVIYGGMIPKVETCLDAVDGGVEAAVILDGRVPHALLLELFTDTSGAGTLIRAD